MRGRIADPGLPGRQLFLQAVAEVEPDVLLTLREAALDLHLQASAEDQSDYAEGRKRGVIEMRSSPIWEEVETAVQGWAKRWHLTDDWILEAARGTLRLWDAEILQGLNPRAGWLYDRFVYAWEESERVQLEVPGWEPGLEARRDAERRIRAELDRQLREYLDRIEALAISRGFQPLPPHRSRERGAKGKVHRHYVWLAQWQVQEKTYAEIAGYKVDPRSVASAIAQRASEIGLTPRTRLT